MATNFIHEFIDEEIAEGKHEYGKIQTRFPPEPNGYLHIGHAKALFVDFSTAEKYGGKCNLRFDDTNPAKEDTEYVDAIKEDIHWLGYDWDKCCYGSSYFDKCYELAVMLIKKGKAYVCDLDREQMREYRGTLTEPGKNSPWRDRSVEENLDLFERMKNGEFEDGTHTLRAKIDMASPNLNMRDPAIYRIKHISHHQTGDKWCIYPMYDFAHPIQDALEGITHSLCSLEYEAHRPLYNWVVEECGFEHKPRQIEFARLNLTNTVMSKRYLRELVETGLVDGWDDPRMPTLCGLRRRGYTPAAIKEFLTRAGVAKTDSLIDIALLEYCIREELNTSAPRRIAVLDPVKVIVDNYPEDKKEYFDVPNHPGNPEMGTRKVPFTKELWIDRADFAMVPPPKFFRMKPDGEVRLMGAYIVKCTDVVCGENGEVVEIHCTADLETGNGMPADGRKVKGTIHWVSADECDDITVNLYEQLFTIRNVGDIPEDKTYADYLNPDSVKVLSGCKAEKALEGSDSERFQFVRTGYFVKDSKNPGTYNRIVSLKDSFKPE
ncbi:MAG: glutamine--tRNA ligase/YqeY domain fusion protein [Clostridia bacterium]|nr:glutamine--tRNA ligase/YqeY domain fusion protein [Clostridia bacterium]